MNNERISKLSQRQREELLCRYDSALERGDFDVMARILQEAESDSLLERMILEFHEASLAEEDATAEQGDAEIVRQLILKCIPSGLAHQASSDPPPLTVSEVIDRLRSEGSLLTSTAQEEGSAIRQLRQSDAPLPKDLSKRSVRQLFEQMGLSLSDRFQKLFREAAIFLSMGREQQSAQMAAARRQKLSSKSESAPEEQEP